MTDAIFPWKQAVDDALQHEFAFGPFTWGEALGGFSSCNIALTALGKCFVLKQYGPAAAKQVRRLEAIALALKNNDIFVPVPESTCSGPRHFFCQGRVYALFLRNTGSVRHGVDLSNRAIKNTAQMLAKLHSLGSVMGKMELGPVRRRICGDATSLLSEKDFLLRAREARLGREDTCLLKNSLAAKRALIAGSNYRECAFFASAADFVHGDFHNENVLFDKDQQVSCLLDFEDSFIGHGISDVVSFVFVALCSDGLSSKNLKLGRFFVDLYGSIRFVDSQILCVAVARFFLLLASSTFFESRLLAGQRLSVDFLRRDLNNLQIWKKYAQDIVRSLFWKIMFHSIICVGCVCHWRGAACYAPIEAFSKRRRCRNRTA